MSSTSGVSDSSRFIWAKASMGRPPFKDRVAMVSREVVSWGSRAITSLRTRMASSWSPCFSFT